MKRSSIKRGKPMVVSTSLSRKRPKRHPQRSTDPQWRKACADVDSRSGGMCEANVDGVCLPGRHRGAHHHHLILRSRGGPDEAWNLLLVCQPAHDWIHANPTLATELGLMRRADVA